MEDQHSPTTSETGEVNRPINPVRLSSQAVPPYWHHTRSVSWKSVTSVNANAPITLHDNDDNTESTNHSRLWAKAITINDYVIVNGSNAAGLGAYVVWICHVETLDGSPMVIRKRYSEFDQLRNDLIRAFPNSAKTALPSLPPKSAIYKFRGKFLERRRQGLAFFLNSVMLDPVYSGSPVVKDFIFKAEDKGM